MHSGISSYTFVMHDFEISPADAAQLLRDKATGLIDVGKAWEYSAASIQGSYHIPMGEIPARARRELSPEEHLVIVCHHGVRSMNVAAWLRNQGYKHVQSMRGGIEAWSATVDPLVPRY